MLKGGLKTAHSKSLKKSYKALNKEQYKIIKTKEKKEDAEKYLYGHYGFYSVAKRLKSGAVDFSKLDDRTLQAFEKANKAIQKFNKINESVLNKAVDVFNQTQFSFSQSF
jgi:alpha-glucuronidase